MVFSKDVIPEYIPKKTRAVILGTMCSVNAREIDGSIKKAPPFFYHDNRNRFWKILQCLFERDPDPPFLEVDEKQHYLEKWGIALGNIVAEVKIPKKDTQNASDEILFKAHKSQRLQTKKVNKKFRNLLKRGPVYFTCRSKRPLELLLQDYFKKNQLSPDLTEPIEFLHTPTRKSHTTLTEIWRPEFKKYNLL